MSKLWRAGEGRERGREREEKEGAAHHSARRKSKGPRENVMWPAVQPRYSLSLFLGPSMWAGRNGDRKPPTPPTPSPPPLPLILSYPPSALHSLTHSLTNPPLHHPLFPLLHPTFHPSTHSRSFSLPSQGPAVSIAWNSPEWIFPSSHPLFFRCVCLCHLQACLCIITHSVVKLSEVCGGVNCEWVADKTCLILDPQPLLIHQYFSKSVASA